MQYVHGHACIHNLIDYSRVYSSDPYKLLVESKTSCVYAIHPFTYNTQSDYDLVCEDFGYTLDLVEHHWNSLDVHALWEIAKQFNWAQHIADAGILEDIINPTYIYMRWYNNIFKEHYSINDYYDLMGVQ